MLPFNQQGAPDASFNASKDNAYFQQWTNVQHHWGHNTAVTQFYPQVQYSSSLSRQPIHNQINQHKLNSPSFNPVTNQHLQYQKRSTPFRAHQALISLVPNSSGIFKAVIKRKRHRTMFTTEQIEALELVFQSKPYVTREDRLALVNQLQLSDASVKVWFQNRRLRGKRAAEEAAEEAAEQATDKSVYAVYNNTEESSYCFNSFHPVPTESISPTMSNLAVIESELLKKVDESGYITLDDKSMGVIVSLIDSALSAQVSTPSNTPNEIADLIRGVAEKHSEVKSDSETSTHTESSYEPVSPPDSPASNRVDSQMQRWEQLVPEESLHRLFDLHFC